MAVITWPLFLGAERTSSSSIQSWVLSTWAWVRFAGHRGQCEGRSYESTLDVVVTAHTRPARHLPWPLNSLSRASGSLRGAIWSTSRRWSVLWLRTRPTPVHQAGCVLRLEILRPGWHQPSQSQSCRQAPRLGNAILSQILCCQPVTARKHLHVAFQLLLPNTLLFNFQ